MESNAFKALIVALVGMLMMTGCMALSTRKPVELTFAGTSVMLRGVEAVTTQVEYFDATAKAVKVKRATITPPFWIVSDELLNKTAAK
jgi:hypothetical protein